MIAGCYSLDLYCDKLGQIVNDDGTDALGHAYDEFPHQYTDELGSVCRSTARKAGWILRANGAAICPKCSGKKRPRKLPETQPTATGSCRSVEIK